MHNFVQFFWLKKLKTRKFFIKIIFEIEISKITNFFFLLIFTIFSDLKKKLEIEISKITNYNFLLIFTIFDDLKKKLKIKFYANLSNFA